MSAAVVMEGLTRRFGSFTAVDRLSMTLEEGQVTGWLGPNGSGKTTTIRMLLGLLQPSAGQARVLGCDIRRQPEAIRANCGYMSQKFALYQELTVLENLAFYGGVYGVGDNGRVAQVLEELGLAGVAGQRVASLAGGWRQRVALGVALVHRPRLLFLDEPTSGVDPLARRAFWDLIYGLAAGGVSVVVTTHYMDEAEYCQRVAILRQGRLLALDSPTRLKQQTGWQVWRVRGVGLLAGLEVLQSLPGVLRAGLDSDCLRVVGQAGLEGGTLRRALEGAGLSGAAVEPGAVTMEDVFLGVNSGEQ